MESGTQGDPSGLARHARELVRNTDTENKISARDDARGHTTRSGTAGAASQPLEPETEQGDETQRSVKRVYHTKKVYKHGTRKYAPCRTEKALVCHASPHQGAGDVVGEPLPSACVQRAPEELSRLKAKQSKAKPREREKRKRKREREQQKLHGKGKG